MRGRWRSSLSFKQVACHPAATRDLWLTSGSTADILRGERERTPARIPPLPVSVYPSFPFIILEWQSGRGDGARAGGYGRF